RSDRVKPLGEAHVIFVRRDLEADVTERLQLLLDGGDHLRMLMTGIDHGDAGGKVDIALALRAPAHGVLARPEADRRRMTGAARHGSRPRRLKRGRICRLTSVFS